MSYLLIALAPVFIIAFYVYFRDKYDREPIGLLLKSLLVGGIIVIPILFFEQWIAARKAHLEGLNAAFYTAFMVAALVEESFKFIGLFYLIWRKKEFDEKFDGIVYAVFVSLGFAAVENVMYVYQGGVTVGLMRAITAVPAHALFGVAMGYYFGMAKFRPKKRSLFLLKAFIVPVVLHGIYDFILMSGIHWLLVFFVILMVGMYIFAFRRMKELNTTSRFKPKEVV